MTKFRVGETSAEVLNRKRSITKSIIQKTKVLQAIREVADIPQTLQNLLRSHNISQAAIHKWEDSTYGVISYSRNSAHAAHNEDVLATLLVELNKANERIDGLSQNSKHYSTKPTRELDNLRLENEQLKTALAEVYRAYLQLLDNFKEDERVSNAIRNIILKQAKELGSKRIKEV